MLNLLLPRPGAPAGPGGPGGPETYLLTSSPGHKKLLNTLKSSHMLKKTKKLDEFEEFNSVIGFVKHKSIDTAGSLLVKA